jgi:predicted RecA/RadA family phage recombinase
MATNFIQPGECLDLAAPYNRVSGEGALVGTIFGVATRDVASVDTIPFCVCGVWRLAKTAAQAWTVGQRIFWDDSNKRCDSDPTAGQLIGYATAAAADPSSTGDVSLCCCPPELSEGKQAAVADLVDNSGGAAADGTIGAVTAPTALTHAVGTADNTVADVGAAFNQTTLNDNFKELTTAQAANRTAIIALTDAIKELSTKQNALLASLRLTGLIAS